jgi:hypothetical protein
MVAEAVSAELLLGEAPSLKQDAPRSVEDPDALDQQPTEAIADGMCASVRGIGHRTMLAHACDRRSAIAALGRPGHGGSVAAVVSRLDASGRGGPGR